MAARQSLVEVRIILFFTFLLWMRGEDSNLRPPGYGPGKLPLLYRAVFWDLSASPDAERQ